MEETTINKQNITFSNLLKSLDNYKQTYNLLYQDEKSEISLFIHNFLYKYWNILNFTSLNLLSILSHLIELAYKPINKYSKSKLPPKFYEMIFENLFNKIHIIRFLLNKIKDIGINIRIKTLLNQSKLIKKEIKNKEKDKKFEVEIEFDIDFIKNITKDIINSIKYTLNVVISTINISTKTIKPTKDKVAILFVGKPKLSNKETLNKENETTTKNQKICQKFPTKEKPTINFKPTIFNEKEEKIENNIEIEKNNTTLDELGKLIEKIYNTKKSSFHNMKKTSDLPTNNLEQTTSVKEENNKIQKECDITSKNITNNKTVSYHDTIEFYNQCNAFFHDIFSTSIHNNKTNSISK